MAPNVVEVATFFGGSMNFNNRAGIGRFGMAMKTVALSMSSVMELYFWQEPSAFYSMTCDVEAIARERSNAAELPYRTLMKELPDQIADLFAKPMSLVALNQHICH